MPHLRKLHLRAFFWKFTKQETLKRSNRRIFYEGLNRVEEQLEPFVKENPRYFICARSCFFLVRGFDFLNGPAMVSYIMFASSSNDIFPPLSNPMTAELYISRIEWATILGFRFLKVCLSSFCICSMNFPIKFT